MDGNGNPQQTAQAETAALPTTVAQMAIGAALPAEFTTSMPAALALYLNDALYERVTSIAARMARADGMTPKHLLGKPEACFAVVSRAITWHLDPFAVALATYQTPGGSIGFEGKLIHAIIENSGKLEPTSGGVRYQHYGDWSKVQGKFEIRDSKKQDGEGNAKRYAAATWNDDHARAGKPADQEKYPLAQSCGVRVSAHLRGERDPRTLDFDLIQAQPRNSTLWATDPMTQICYTAVRRFASAVAPSLIMGVPFDAMDTFEPVEVHGERVDQPRSKSETRGEVTQPAAKRAKGDTYDNGFSDPAQQPKSKASAATAAPTEKINTATGEVTQESAAAPEAQQQGSEGAGVPASAGMLTHIRKRLETATLSEADVFKRFKIQRLDGIDVATANAIIAWTADPAS